MNMMLSGYKKYYSYLFEGANQDLALNKLKKENLEKVYDKLLTIDKSQNNKHLPKLVDYYIETKDLNLIESYYDRFIDSKIKDKDINLYKTFHDFELAVDANNVSIENKSKIEVNGTPVYEDSNVKIFKGDSQKACIQYGDGYGFCLSSKTLTSNLFYRYRLKDQLTAYFIRFIKKSQERNERGFVDPLHLIVLHVGYESMMWTGADNGGQGNGTENITKEELLKKFPALKPAFEKGKLVCDKYSEVEKDILNYIHNKVIQDKDFVKFTPRIRTAYIQMGKRLSDKMWDVCNYDQRLMYVNTGSSIDLTPYQKQSMSDDKKFMENYKRMLRIRVDVKLKGNKKLTPDEIDEVMKNPEFVQERVENNKKIIEQAIKNKDITSDNCKVSRKNIWFKFPVKFPERMSGNFDCGYNHLTSLEHCPQSVVGDFNCIGNNLTSLEHCPQSVVGDFYCGDNILTSLQGAPQRVVGDFYCSDNHLTSLEGAPQSVVGDFNCSDNNLTSLEGCPQSVGGVCCARNHLTSLEGCPQSVGWDFDCGDNILTSLEGCPQSVDGDFNCSDNNLTSLQGAPQRVDGGFNCIGNNLTSLEGCPQILGGGFNCSDNHLTSLQGCPQSVDGDFSCSDQKNGHKFTEADVRAVCKVKGKVYV